MSDVTAIHNLVQKRKELKNEISTIIVGQDAVVDQILLSISKKPTKLTLEPIFLK